MLERSFTSGSKREERIGKNNCFEYLRTVKAKAVFTSTKMFLIDGLTDFYILGIYLLKCIHVQLIFVHIDKNNAKF